MAPVNKPTQLLSKEINDTIFSKMVRPNCVSLVTTVATLFFFSGKDFIQQIVGVVCFECDLRSKCHYLRIYNLEDNDLFFDEKIGSNGIKLNSEDPLFFKIDFDCGTIGLQFQFGPEANMEAKELEKALRAGKIMEEMQPAIDSAIKNLDNKYVTQLDFANDPMLREIMTLMGLEYAEVVKSQKIQANLRELIHNMGGIEKFLVKLKARPPDHKAMRAKARADQQKQDKQAVSPPMQTLKLNSTAAEISLQQSTESQSRTETKSHMPKIEVVQPLEPRDVQKTSLLTTKLSSATSVTNVPSSSLQSTGAAQLSSEAMRSPTISTKTQPNRSLESSQTALMSQKATPTNLQQNYSQKLIQSPGMSPQGVKSLEASLDWQQPINNSPEKGSKSFATEKSLQSPQPHPNATSGLPKILPQTKTVDPSPTISSPPSALPPAIDDEIPIPELKYALPNVRRKVRAVARDGLPEREHDGVTQPNPVRRNIGWVGKTVRPEKEKDDKPIPGPNGAEPNVGRPCRNILKKPEDESTRWTAEKLEIWQHDPVLIEILKLWGLKYEDFCKSEKWQDTLEALIKVNGGPENLVQKRLEAIRKSEAEEEIPKPKVNKLKIPTCLNWAQEKADDSPESESQAETSQNLPKVAVEKPAQPSQEQTAYPMPANQPPSPSLQAQAVMHQDPSSVSPMSSRPEQSQITPVKKQHNHSLESSQTLESQPTPATNQQLNYPPPMPQTSSVSSKTTVQSQTTPVKSLEPNQSSILPRQTLQSPSVPKVKTQQNDLPESSRSILSSHTSNKLVTQKSLKSPLAPTKSSPEKLPLSPNKMLHPVIFSKHPATPKPSVFTHEEDGSIYFVRTPRNDKEDSGKIQSAPIESIKNSPASATPRTQFHDDDDDEYQRNANLRDNWQKRVQNRTPAASPSTPARLMGPKSENKMIDAKGSGLKTTENVKNDTDQLSNRESKVGR